MIVKNLLPEYQKHMYAQYLPDFKAIIEIGQRIEDGIQSGVFQDKSSNTSNRYRSNNNSRNYNAQTSQTETFLALVFAPKLSNKFHRSQEEIKFPLAFHPLPTLWSCRRSLTENQYVFDKFIRKKREALTSKKRRRLPHCICWPIPICRPQSSASNLIPFKASD